MLTNGAPHDEIVQPSQISKEWLFNLYHDAYFDVERDNDGDVCIRDGFRVWVFPIREGTQLRFLAQFRANPDHDLADRLLYVNRINDELHLVRAYVDRDGDIGFDGYQVIAGGTTRRNIVLATRSFIEHVRAALIKDETNVIA